MILYLFLFCSLSFAGIEQPIVSKLYQLQLAMLSIGKAIIAISLIVAIILFIIGRPQWKWLSYILLGAIMLMSSSNIITWMVG